MKTLSDESIVKLYLERNELAIEETAKKYSAYLEKVAFNILSDREDAKESVNDTYLAAWDSIPPHRPVALSTYLSKLTRRISIDIIRKKNRDKRKAGEYALSLSELCDFSSNSPQPDEEAETKLLTEKISDYLREIKPEARNVFIGRYFYFDSVRDIARYCKISESKVKTLLHRTRTDLRQYLEKEGYFI